ncbi:hypothetical protein COCCADRAFT_113642 [Bipolaris zeicola 26-R-13]|uniref:Uncharacterized protein n=1 Tax=Cochliobolus carbonum (strain 26-R-13) TaxID=930089 RepID=W6XMD3_COCC2|nr:uncharacterized protein COCCADRAFT_113642 [Bipolaris zeicola 26-R-13]EUC26688.1 hypothetical protein COCCADRAFT_113642 [Bipolaris zeicola 26-R-13]
MADELFNLNIEYLSNPKLFSKNSLIFCIKGSCVSDLSNSDLSKQNEPSPSINPSNQ